MKRATYYNILGLTPGSSKEEIRSSFRKLALRYHPDRNPANSAHTVFIAIQNAYQVLIDEKTRKEYDVYLAHAAPRAEAGQRPSRKQDPRVQQTLSVFNSTLWDLEDLLKKFDNENMTAEMGGSTLYTYILNLFGYLEKTILNESSRFSQFAGKQDRSKLHIDNYFYLLRMDISRFLSGLENEPDDSSRGLRKLVSAEAQLIKSIGEMRRRIFGKT
jgi:DnaJ-class molecular chaperone